MFTTNDSFHIMSKFDKLHLDFHLIAYNVLTAIICTFSSRNKDFAERSEQWYLQY